MQGLARRNVGGGGGVGGEVEKNLIAQDHLVNVFVGHLGPPYEPAIVQVTPPAALSVRVTGMAATVTCERQL